MDSNLLAKNIKKAADDKKAHDILVLDIREISPITDYFLICSAQNKIQVKAIADNIEEKVQKEGILMLHKEGYNESLWTLLDYGDVVVHIFTQTEREFYSLEKLWSDAKEVNFDD